MGCQAMKQFWCFSLKAPCNSYIIKEDSLASTNQPTCGIKVSTSQFTPNLVGPQWVMPAAGFEVYMKSWLVLTDRKQ
jgi:hypothetical protein